MIQLQRRQRAILLHARLNLHAGDGAVAGAEHCFFSREHQFDRARGLAGQQRGNYGIFPELQLGAECAANIVADHAHVVVRHVHRPCKRKHAGVIHSLGGIPDGDFIAVPFHNRAVGLESRMHLRAGGKGFLENKVRFGESFLDAAAFGWHGLARGIAGFKKFRRIRLGGRIRINNKGENLVLDLDCF